VKQDRVTAYASAVLAGELLAGQPVKNACQRHLDDLKAGKGRGLAFDLNAAQHAIDFCEQVLCLNGDEYEGKPFKLNPWQAFILGSLMGWKTQDGHRRFKVAYIETAKGSGKSPLAAAIGLYGMLLDNMPRAEVYAAATKKDQAKILFRDAVAMVDQSPYLSRRIKKHGRGLNCHQLSHEESGSLFKAISSEDGQSGPRPHIVLLDEIHEHKTAHVIDMMRAGIKKDKNALIIMITNSGHDRTSVCWHYHEYGQKVASGMEQDDRFFAYICALDEGEDPLKDETCWAKANPSLPYGLPTIDYLRGQVREARGMPSKQSVVKRLNFCQWVDAANPWISGEVWLACEQEFSLEDIDEGELCFGGLDLSNTRDLTAFALYFPHLGVAAVEFWRPKDTLYEYKEKDRVPYDLWLEQGFIHAEPGSMIDFGYVAARIGRLNQRFNIKQIAYDPYSIKRLKREAEAQNLKLNLVPHGQGYFKSEKSQLWMSRSIDLLEQALKDGQLKVAKNPCLRWNAACATVTCDSQENRKFDKLKANGRIDGIVALAMAVGVSEYQGDHNDLSEHLLKYGVRRLSWG